MSSIHVEYNLFDSSDDFYNDICTPYTTETGTDLSLSDRKELLANASALFCQVGCTFQSYNSTIKKAKCDCTIQQEDTDVNTENIEFVKEPSIGDTFKNANFLVLKCYKLVFIIK